MRRLSVYVLTALLALSCGRGDAESMPPGHGETAEVRFGLSASPSMPEGTRSSVPAPEDAIGDVTMFFYEDGLLVPELTVSGSGGGGGSFSASVSLGIGHGYEIFALANCHVSSPPPTIGEARELRYTFESLDDWSGGLPMAGYREIRVSWGMAPVQITLTRLVARLDLTIDTSGLEHGSIGFTSVKVRQMNRNCPFWGDGAAESAADVCDGDLACASDIAGINGSQVPYAATFYLLENLQGDILQGNDDPNRKVPEAVTERGADPGLCTFLEILGTYSDRSGYLTGEPLEAHLFLGRDATSNFDLRRNSRYSVVLRITDRGCLRTDWKIDSHLEDRRILSFGSGNISVEPSATTTVALNTNLSLARNDYSYSVTGDTSAFEITTGPNGFTVTALPGASGGASVTVTVRTWDGAVSSSCLVTARGGLPPGIHCDWDGPLYVAQRGTLTINVPSLEDPESILVYATGPGVDVTGEGTTWYIDGIYACESVIKVLVDGRDMGTILIDVLSPNLRFVSEEMVLPLDGSSVECGPFYFRDDGTRLRYEDFNPDLYDRLLSFDVTRYGRGDFAGRYWSAYSLGNPAVDVEETGVDGCQVYCSNLSRLTVGGHPIDENYDFSQGRVRIERLTAKVRYSLSGVPDAEGFLCVEDPFTGSGRIGSCESWALTSWHTGGSHNESFNFQLPVSVASGYSSSSLTADTDADGPEARFTANGTVRLTLPYDSKGFDAMPPATITLTPGIVHGQTGDVFRSPVRYTVNCKVNLAVGGVAADNGSGGADVSVEWNFPRTYSGPLHDIEDVVASRNADARGLYNVLYSVEGTSAEALRAGSQAQFALIKHNAALRQSNLVTSGKLAVYRDPYSFVVWKYGDLYPASKGWLER